MSTATSGGQFIPDGMEAVPVADDDTAETLAARILDVEHRIYPEAVQLLLDGGWKIEGRRFLPRPVTNPA